MYLEIFLDKQRAIAYFVMRAELYSYFSMVPSLPVVHW